jgi:hypothetical protein
MLLKLGCLLEEGTKKPKEASMVDEEVTEKVAVKPLVGDRGKLTR